MTPRLATALSTSDLPEAELCSARLDGELYRLGPSFCAIDDIDCSLLRARALAAVLPVRMIAEQYSVAWVHGLTDRLPYPLQLCARSSARLRPVSRLGWSVREVIIDERDFGLFGGLWLTTPLRTAVDIARFSEEFGHPQQSIVSNLSRIGGFTFEDCLKMVNRRRNLPRKRRAVQRLSEVMR